MAEPHTDRPCVVLVEDNEANTVLIQRVLMLRPAVRLCSAKTGGAGLEAIRAELPLLVLLDRRLPDMSGDDVLRALMADPATADVPVVVLSGDARDQVEGMRDLGATDFLTKPFELDALLAVVDRFCPTAG